jgi:ribosomal protein L34E
MPGKEFVAKLLHFAKDDEDDTELFNSWQEQVLLHCPNPERIGCLDHETLRVFVETPGALDLTDPKYIHITQCAECTRELQGLRALREERLRQESGRESHRSSARWKWTATIAATVAVAVVLAAWGWKRHLGDTSNDTQQLASVPATVDLSADGASRDAGQESASAAVSLPRSLIQLRLILPYYSPIGNYRIIVSKDRSGNRIKAEGSARAVAQGSRTEVDVKLDLRRVSPGTYYLGTALEGDGAPYYYPLRLNQ